MRSTANRILRLATISPLFLALSCLPEDEARNLATGVGSTHAAEVETGGQAGKPDRDPEPSVKAAVKWSPADELAYYRGRSKAEGRNYVEFGECSLPGFCNGNEKFVERVNVVLAASLRFVVVFRLPHENLPGLPIAVLSEPKGGGHWTWFHWNGPSKGAGDSFELDAREAEGIYRELCLVGEQVDFGREDGGFDLGETRIHSTGDDGTFVTFGEGADVHRCAARGVRVRIGAGAARPELRPFLGEVVPVIGSLLASMKGRIPTMGE